MKPQVTWLLPVLNGAAFLHDTLQSLEAQSLPGQPVLAWDNGSADATIEILRSFIPARIPGRIIADQPLPLGDCLARLVDTADTEFCARIDADDIAEPTRLAHQLEALVQNPGWAAVGSSARIIDSTGALTGEAYPAPTDWPDIVGELLYGCPLIHPSVLFRREAIRLSGNYRHGLPGATGWAEDLDLWQRVVAHGLRLGNLPEPLLRYRVHGASVTAGWKARDELRWRRALVCAANAQTFLGVDPADSNQLLRETTGSKFAASRRVLNGLRRWDGVSPSRRLRRPRFWSGFEPLLPPTDSRTRTWAALLRGDCATLLHSLRRAARRLVPGKH